MYNILLSLHNFLRWIILLLLIINIVRHVTYVNKPFTTADKKLGLWLMTFAHIQLLIGLYQWFAGAWGFQNIKNSGMQTVMHDNTYRFFAIEHSTGMIIAIILITVAYGVFRKSIPDNKKHIRSLVFYILALIIILACIPWTSREGIGRPLWRGF